MDEPTSLVASCAVFADRPKVVSGAISVNGLEAVSCDIADFFFLGFCGS